MKYSLFFISALFLLLSCGQNISLGTNSASSAGNKVSTVVDEPAGSNCLYGGKKVELGEDLNNNGSLESNEIISSIFACNQQGTFNYLTLELNEPAGANCAYAGTVVKGGLDLNNNGVLDQDEVQDVKYVCNSKPEYKVLVETVEEPVGDNCPLGGVKVLSGYDMNGDSLLGSDEITESYFKCNTEADFQALVVILNLDFSSKECPLGGTKVIQGLDINKNNILDPNEIKNSATVLSCLRAEDFLELSRVESLAFGSNECALSGEKIFKGRDTNSSGILEDSEILSTTVSCKSGSDFNSLVVINDLSFNDPNCHLGGKETTTGLDYNGNGVLEDNEIIKESTVYNCYTESDYTQLLVESVEPMGGKCGIYGGTKVEKGLDYNKDGLLNTEEIDSSLTNYNCLSAQDFNTLIIVTDEPFNSPNCSLGGKKTDTGMDLNKNGILDVYEIEKVDFSCYAPDHFNLLSRTTEEPNGSNCSLGGKKTEQGRDYNGNGVLDSDELDSKLTQYNCYSPVDFNLLAKTYDEQVGENCPLGGTRTERGRDTNTNTVLDPSEVDSTLTTYDCTQSFSKSTITVASPSVFSGASVLVKLSLVDELGLPVNRSGVSVVFISSGGTSIGDFGTVIDNLDGTYSSIFTGIKVGTPIVVSAIVGGEEILTTKPLITVIEDITLQTGYLKFNGSNGYVDVPDKPNLNFTGSFSVATLVKWEVDPSTGQQWSNIICKGQDTTGWKIQHNQTNTAFEFATKTTGSSNKWVWSTTKPQQGVWYHVIGVYDQTQGKMFIYVNGKLENQASVSGSFMNTSNSINIGRNSPNIGRYFNGSIDEVIILNKAVSAAEALALYNNGISAVDSSSVVSYWKFDLVSISSGVTKTGDMFGGNDGTLKGGVEFIKR